MAIERITKEDLKSKLDAGEDIQLLDVRNPVDYGTSDVKIGAAIRIPVGELEFRYTELDREKEVISYCT
jgi:rhodanese-related sulfurtransferase